MPPSAHIRFNESDSPIQDPVNKFGGQPVWVGAPAWPNSATTGNPMRFICQIRLDSRIFGGDGNRMAYLFMTDEADDSVDGTWEPDGGENAVIIQEIATSVHSSEGPTLYQMVDRGGPRLVQITVELAVELELRDDPPFVAETERFEWPEEEDEAYSRKLEGNKIGGSPLFLQNDEIPEDGAWDLLLQLDSTKVPFSINFGDAGVGYAFISRDRRKGKFLWQCC